MSKHKIKKNKKRKILFNKVSKIGKSIISRGMNGLVFIPQKMCIYVHFYIHQALDDSFNNCYYIIVHLSE